MQTDEYMEAQVPRLCVLQRRLVRGAEGKNKSRARSSFPKDSFVFAEWFKPRFENCLA